MAQTTGGMSAFDLMLGWSINGSTFTNVSGSSNSVAVDGGERAIGSALTFDGDYPIVKAGKRGVITVTIRGIYTEITSQLYALAKAAYEAGTVVYVRWSPGGGDAGDFGYTTGAAYVKSLPYPGGEADSADPILTEVQLDCAVITQATIGTAGWT
jgi:hypothetical protein